MAIISRNFSAFTYYNSILIFTLQVTLPSCRTFWTPVHYPDNESLKEAVKQWLEGQTEDFYLVELTVCQKCRRCTELSRDKMKNKVQFVTFPFFYSVSPKKSPLKFSDIFSQTVGNFQSKFYAPIIRSYLRWRTNFYSTICNFDEVMPY